MSAEYVYMIAFILTNGVMWGLMGALFQWPMFASVLTSAACAFLLIAAVGVLA